MASAPYERALRHALRFRASLAERPVGASASADQLRAALGGPLQENPLPAAQVIDQLALGAEKGLVATAGPRFFGLVIGGSSDAAGAGGSRPPPPGPNSRPPPPPPPPSLPPQPPAPP